MTHTHIYISTHTHTHANTLAAIYISISYNAVQLFSDSFEFFRFSFVTFANALLTALLGFAIPFFFCKDM